MNSEILRTFCNREHLALLYLIIKVAASNKSISLKQQAAIKEFLNLNHLKLTDSYVYSVAATEYDDIALAFNKSNLNCAYSIIKNFVKQNGINPGHEDRCLDAFKRAIKTAVSDSDSAVVALPIFSGAPGVGTLPDVRGQRKRKPI